MDFGTVRIDRWGAAIAAALVAVLGGCGDDPAGVTPRFGEDAVWLPLDAVCSPDSPAYSLPLERRDSLPPAEPQSPNGRLAEIARVVPGGFGGFFSLDGEPVLYLVDPTQSEAAIAALDTILDADLEGVRVVKARWDSEQLYDWYRYLDLHVWEGGGVSMSVIDALDNRLFYGVVHDSVLPLVSDRVAALDVPCFLVASSVTGRFYAY